MGEVLMSSMGKNRFKIETVGTAVALNSTAPAVVTQLYLMKNEAFEELETPSVYIDKGQYSCKWDQM